jgi:hypothetical protein
MSIDQSDSRREAARRPAGVGLFATVVALALSATALTIVAAPADAWAGKSSCPFGAIALMRAESEGGQARRA